ncbi:hypothetical protein C0J52_20601 [Blattella germanica]|nr:hypothetical protein C0J52_20601 [Blattella germanica]
MNLDDDVLGLDLLGRLDSDDLCALRKFFFIDEEQTKKKLKQRKQFRHKKKSQSTPDRGANYGGEPLTKKQFIKAIEKVVGKFK